MEDLPFLYQVGHHGCHRFRLHVGVCAVLVVEVDMVGLQAAQGAFDRTAYRLGTRVRNDGVRAGGFGMLERNAEFGGKDNLVAEGSEGFAQQFLAIVRTGGGAI